MKTKIAVSVLSADFAKLGEEIALLSEADIIHLDIMDGHYVPNLSYGYPLVRCFRKLTDKPLDAHLMVTNPDEFIDELNHKNSVIKEFKKGNIFIKVIKINNVPRGTNKN